MKEIRTLEQFERDMHIFIVAMTATLVFTSIAVPLGILAMLTYSIVMSLRLKHLPGFLSILYRMALVALCSVAPDLGLILISYLVWGTINRVRNERNLRIAYMRYLALIVKYTERDSDVP